MDFGNPIDRLILIQFFLLQEDVDVFITRNESANDSDASDAPC